MKKLFALLLSVLLLVSAVGCNALAGDIVADEVIFGKIITMDDNNTVAGAVAAKDGRIIFVGSKEDAFDYIGENTAIYDYENNCVYPGFIDGHSHLGLLSTFLVDGATLSAADSLRQDAETVKRYIEKHPGKKVYKGMGFWIHHDDEDKPTHEVLDKYASSEVPIVIVGGGGHAALLNQKAIEYFKIKDLISVYGTDGIKVDADGNPTGYLVETPRFDILQKIPISKEELKEFFFMRQDAYIKQGYTCICDAGVVETENLPMVSALQELADEHRLKIRVRALCELADVDKEPMKAIDRIAEMAGECDSEYFKITGVKIFLDGVVEALTAWTLKPYTSAAGKGDNYRGYQRWSDSRKKELIEIIKAANKKGLQVHMHAIGEGAATYGLDCYEAAHKALPDVDARNGLAHLAYETDEMIKRFADNKVIAFVNPQWSTWKGGTKEDEIKIYGEKEAQKMYRIKSFIDAGVVTSFHTDSAGTVPEMVYTAVTRKDPIASHLKNNYRYFSDEVKSIYPDEIRGEDERLDALTSLKCLTTASAYSLKEEDNLGSIEVGKAADFVVYDTDFSNDEVAGDVSCTNAVLLSSFVDGKMIFPASHFQIPSFSDED